jgi:hypothetical protein
MNSITIEYIPGEIIQIIFSLLPITDKRRFIRTCHTYHLDMTASELIFQKMINRTKYFYSGNYTGFYNPLFKYTIELFYDNYTIPDHYIIPENRVLHQYKKIHYKTGQRGDLDFIKKLLSLSEKYADWISYGAAKGGHIVVLEWMNDEYGFNAYITRYAAGYQNINILKWLRKAAYIGMDDMAVNYAAKGGNLDMLKWVLKYTDCSDEVLWYASMGKHLHIMKYLAEKYPKTTVELQDDFYCSVGGSGDLEIVEWTIKNLGANKSQMVEICRGAGIGSHIHILEHIKNNYEVDIDNLVCNSIILYGGSLSCLKWAVSHGFYLSKESCELASNNDDLEMLKWLVDNNCLLSSNCYMHATKCGNIEILKYLKEKNIPFSIYHNLCNIAADNGYLDIFKWCIENGLKIRKGIMYIAAENGHLELMKYAKLIGCEFDGSEYPVAIDYAHLDVLKWLKENDCHMDDDEGICMSAINNGHLHILQWLMENKFTCGVKSHKLALKMRNEKIIRYLMPKINYYDT